MVKRIQSDFSKEELSRQFENRGFSRQEVTRLVSEIIENVDSRGDEALCEYSEKFDKVKIVPDNFAVKHMEIEAAGRVLDSELIAAVELAAERIRRFHEAQVQRSWRIEEPGCILGQDIRPLQNVGVYAPGGSAVLFSTALMNIIPAQVAGCERIVMTSPPQASLEGSLSPSLLSVADILGENEIYKVGGAQAVAALALGTQSVPKVDMICGPGNIYVTEAKRQVQGQVKIDSLAGPTEVVIIADRTARADFLAADLLAQLEHDESAAAMLLSTSPQLLEEVEKEIDDQKKLLQRQDILSKSMEGNCYLVHSATLDDAFEVANLIAPEHLELVLHNPHSYVARVEHAGAIFLGDYTPEAMGDYIAGPNHVLPTGRTARFSSGLSVDDFIKKSSVVSFEPEGFQRLAQAAMLIAQAEGLDAHAHSIRIRH